MDHTDFVVAIAVGMSISTGWPAMGCPPGMTNADRPANGWNHFAQFLYPDGILVDLYAVASQGYTAGIITSILQSTQTPEENGLSLSFPDITGNAAHRLDHQTPVRQPTPNYLQCLYLAEITHNNARVSYYTII